MKQHIDAIKPMRFSVTNINIIMPVDIPYALRAIKVNACNPDQIKNKKAWHSNNTISRLIAVPHILSIFSVLRFSKWLK
jgi:hypothetical protein